jgi:hypothetical protein
MDAIMLVFAGLAGALATVVVGIIAEIALRLFRGKSLNLHGRSFRTLMKQLAH